MKSRGRLLSSGRDWSDLYKIITPVIKHPMKDGLIDGAKVYPRQRQTVLVASKELSLKKEKLCSFCSNLYNQVYKNILYKV